MSLISYAIKFILTLDRVILRKVYLDLVVSNYNSNDIYVTKINSKIPII